MESHFQAITQEAEETSNAVGEINQAGSAVNDTSQTIGDCISRINEALHSTRDHGASVTQQAIEASEETEIIFRELAGHDRQAFYVELLREAHQAARMIAEILSTQVTNGNLTTEQVFSTDYQLLPDTQPPKYSTPYDKLTDQLFPAVQEPILERYRHVLYAGAVDRNGYFPTHNRIYSQPLTGHYEKDLLHNRTKRIFNDRTGKRCGSNTEHMLLQTYKRDTGEVLHDLSVPIMIDGQHWGGFRIGFKRP